MTLKELQSQLHTLILVYRLTGDEQVLIPDICTQADPRKGGDTACVSTAGIIDFADKTRAVLLVDTKRAEAIALRQKLLKP